MIKYYRRADNTYADSYDGDTGADLTGLIEVPFAPDNANDIWDEVNQVWIHTPTPVYKLTGLSHNPSDIDYDLFGLHKNKILVKGEFVEVEYYKNFDGTTYSDLVVKETRVYFRPQMGLVYTRTMNIDWYMSDDSIGFSKPDIIKYYNTQEAMEEAETRRHNVFSDAKLYTASQVGIADALDLMSSVNNEISLYIQGLQQPLLDAITASTKLYLTQAIKDTLASILPIND